MAVEEAEVATLTAYTHLLEVEVCSCRSSAKHSLQSKIKARCTKRGASKASLDHHFRFCSFWTVTALNAKKKKNLEYWRAFILQCCF